jgi:hypothetical protein
MASPFFKPLFQIVVDPPIWDMVNASGKPLFSRGVSYVLAPLAFLILEKDKSGLGASYFVPWNRLGLCSCNCRVKRCVIAVCSSVGNSDTAQLAEMPPESGCKRGKQDGGVQNGRRW